MRLPRPSWKKATLHQADVLPYGSRSGREIEDATRQELAWAGPKPPGNATRAVDRLVNEGLLEMDSAGQYNRVLAEEPLLKNGVWVERSAATVERKRRLPRERSESDHPPTIPDWAFEQLLVEQQVNGLPTCPVCGIRFLGRRWFHGDHITPWSWGGKHEYANWQLLCIACNLKSPIGRILMRTCGMKGGRSAKPITAAPLRWSITSAPVPPTACCARLAGVLHYPANATEPSIPSASTWYASTRPLPRTKLLPPTRFGRR